MSASKVRRQLTRIYRESYLRNRPARMHAAWNKLDRCYMGIARRTGELFWQDAMRSVRRTGVAR